MAKAKEDDGDQLPLNLQGGTNLTKIKQGIASADRAITKLEADRDAISAKIQEHREAVKALGIGKRQFDQARRDKKADTDVRVESDLSYQVAREALGIPLDPFTSADTKSDKNPHSAPKASSSVPKKAAAARAPKKAAKSEKATDKKGAEVVDLAGNVIN